MSNDEDTLFVRTTPTLDGTDYIAVLELGDDHSVELSDELSQRLARHIEEACVRAEFDSKVFRQMSTIIELSPRQCAETILELREKRPFMDVDGLPFIMVPNVTQDGRPFLLLQIDHEAIGQIELSEAYQLASHISSACSWARRDQEYYLYLTTTIGTEESIARNAIHGLSA